jgi:hypothetical protein
MIDKALALNSSLPVTWAARAWISNTRGDPDATC